MRWRQPPTPIGFHRESYRTEESHGQLYDFPIEDRNSGHHFGNAFYHSQPTDTAAQNYGFVAEKKEVKKKVQFGSDSTGSKEEIKKEEVDNKADALANIDSAANDFIRLKHESFTKQRLLSLQGKA